MNEVAVVPIVDPSQVGEARRIAVELARAIGFNEEQRGGVALVVTEIGANLVKYATGGEALLRQIETPGGAGIETLALDRGPGMGDTEACLRDGFSTAGTPGTGLGAVMRLSSQFGIWSRPGVGTAIVSRIFAHAKFARPAPDNPIILGAVSRPMAGETECGDAWALCQAGDHQRILLVDGLGHGPVAAEAAAEAVRIFRASTQGSLEDVVDEIHRGTRHTRGMALALTELDVHSQQIRFAGVGNISGVILSHNVAHGLMSHNGTVGHQIRRIQQISYSWPRGSTLVLHSDGIKTRWNLDDYPGLLNSDPALIAGILYRDFQRGSDDVTALAVRASA